MIRALCLALPLAACGAPDPPGTLRLTRHVQPSDVPALLARFDRTGTVICDTPGGHTLAMQLLAAQIERRGIAVMVPAGATCASGGVYLLLAAARTGNATVSERGTVALHPRYAAPPDWHPGMDRVGFVRRPFEAWAPDWMARGVSEETLRRADRKDDRTFHRLTVGELRALGVRLVP